MKTRSGRLFSLFGTSLGCGLLLATLLGPLGTASAEPENGSREKPILVLDPGGHSADVHGVGVHVRRKDADLQFQR